MSHLKAFLTALVLLSAALPFAPGASAEVSNTDASGDVELSTGVADTTAPAGGASTSVDLTALTISEDDDSVTFVLAVAGLAEPGDSSAQYAIVFDWNKVLYAVIVERYNYGMGEYTYGWLGTMDEPDDSLYDAEGVATLAPRFDAATNTITIDVQKVFLLDKQDRPPVKGEEITGLFVRSQRQTFGITMTGSKPFGAYDRLPDEGELTYKFVAGDEATGHVTLRSYDRVRVSNGGATTFVFQAIVNNHGDKDDTIKLAVEALPEGWEGSVMSPSVMVPAKSEIWIPVFATLPFAHDHGGYSSFILRGTSSRDAAATATLRLGVLHTPIPQPAGHHNELFLHPQAPRESPFSAVSPASYSAGMSTVADHTNELKEVRPSSWTSDGITWPIPLNPALQMGLDFDVTKTAELVGSVLGKWTGEAEITARLLYLPQYPSGNDQAFYDYDSGIPLAEADSQTLQLDLQNPTDFALTLTPTEEADFVPYTPGMNMVLLISLESMSFGTWEGFGQLQPALMTETFKLTLPLNEYHDPLPTLSEVSSVLRLEAVGEVEKAGRPGTLMAYAFKLVNGGDTELAIDVDLAGANAENAELAPSGIVRLGPKEERILTMGVRIPKEATADQVLEVLIFAHAVDDPSKAAIARTMTVVTQGAEAVPDQTEVFAAAQEAQNETPGAGALLVLAALGAVALLVGRRR